MFDEMEDSNHRFYNSGGYVNLGTLIASAESVTNKLVNDGKIYEDLDYFDSMTSSEQFKFNVYLIYTARVRLGSYTKDNVPTLPGLSGPLLPGTVLNSSIYQFIRDTSV